MNMDLHPIGSGNSFFAPTSGTMFQVYGAVKLGSVKFYGAHSSSSHAYMESVSYPLF